MPSLSSIALLSLAIALLSTALSVSALSHSRSIRSPHHARHPAISRSLAEPAAAGSRMIKKRAPGQSHSPPNATYGGSGPGPSSGAVGNNATYYGAEPGHCESDSSSGGRGGGRGGGGGSGSGSNSTGTGSGRFKLVDSFEGQNFFDGWDFFNAPDPTHGLVNYVNADTALSSGLATVDRKTGRAIMKVDSSKDINTSNGGLRDSVRIHSKRGYGPGLTVLDANFMPRGCAVWPAFWSNGPDWPTGGEIDIVEGVHDNPSNQYTLHTSAGCSLDRSARMSGNPLSLDCDALSNGNTGCGVVDGDDASYGSGFNSGGGGAFAMLRNSEGISMWFFPRSNIPDDLAAGNPDPTSWGQPKAHFAATSCNPQFFQEQTLIFDITLCGDWAGATYSSAGCPGTCQDRVNTGSNFADARWEVNYVKVWSD